MEKKKYSKKDYAKIGIIVAVIVVPLVIAYGAAGYFEEGGIKFWENWNCRQMTEFATSDEFNKISKEQHKLFNLDMEPCIEEP